MLGLEVLQVLCNVIDRSRDSSVRPLLAADALVMVSALFSPFAWLPHQLQAGASVAVLARSRSKFDQLLPTLEEKKLPGDKTHFISIDLASTDDIRRSAIEANEWAGGCVDILVNNGESGCLGTVHGSAGAAAGWQR